MFHTQNCLRGSGFRMKTLGCEFPSAPWLFILPISEVVSLGLSLPRMVSLATQSLHLRKPRITIEIRLPCPIRKPWQFLGLCLSSHYVYHLLFISCLLFSCSIVYNSFATPWTVAHQAPLLMGFSRQEYWSGMFIAVLFTIARTWKQPRCLSSDEWIRKLWYIYTVEYYSAIKKKRLTAFESVLIRWTKVEPIIQSEVSQKEKHQYRILTHVYGI